MFSASGDFIDRLEGPERREALPKESILPKLGLSPKDVALDLGAGIGYFTFPMAELAGEVISVDLEPKMLSIMSSRITDGGVRNVSLVQGEITRLPFSDSSVDFVLAAFVYHEVASQAKLLDECARVLKPTGRLVVIDFQKRSTAFGPPVSERKTPAHVIRTAKNMFRLESRHETGVYYLLNLRRI